MGHYYDKEGNPHFSVTPKKAKEMGLYWSVTEIQKIEASPGLEVWKLNTAIECAHNNPKKLDEDIKEYQKRIKKSMYEGDSVTNLGTRIHDGIEHVLNGDMALGDVAEDLFPFVKPAVDYFKEKEFEVVDLERIVVNSDQGYAGTCDCIAKTSGGLDFILDWKSTKTIPSKPYPSHPEQVSAYAVATFGRDRVMNNEIWGANAYISTSAKDKEGLAKFRVHSYRPEVLAQAYQNFELICQLWRLRNNYDPRTGSISDSKG